MSFVSAGAYSREIDLSLYTETNTNTSFAIAHTFNKGPIGTPTLVSNISRLLDLFGTPINPGTSTVACQGWFAAREYLRQGNKLYITRVDSAASPAAYSAQSLPGGSDQYLATNTNGVTSVSGDKKLTSVGSTFTTSGVLAGDVVSLNGSDAGYYTIVTVTSETEVIVDRNWPVGGQSAVTFTIWSSKKEGGDTGSTSVSSTREFTDSSAHFSSNCASNQFLKIVDVSSTYDNGMYLISTVDSNTKVTVSRDFPRGGLSGLTYAIYGSISAGTNGSTASSGEFSSSGAKFQSHSVQAGDILYIHDTTDTGNNGYYLITGLKTSSEQTTVTVNEASWAGGSLTGLTYSILPGSVKFTGLTKGTWCKGDYIVANKNSGTSTNFNFETRDTGNTISLEIVYNVNRSTIVSEMTDNSAYFSASVLSNRTEPVIGYYIPLSGGSDGYASTVPADYIGNDIAGTGIKSFKNKERYQINLVAVPGQYNQNVQDALVSLAETRGDCMALLDPPDYTTSDVVDTVQEVLDFHNGTYIRTTPLTSNYAAMHWPWMQVYDEYHDVDVWIAPSGHMAGVFTQSDNASASWFAPAGYTRGKVKGAKDLRYSPDQDDRDMLNGPGSNVNPISNFVGQGITVFGQKTLQRTTTSLDRISIRRMLLFVKSAIESVARQLTFEPNDSVLWSQFTSLCKPVLDRVLIGRGVREYLVLADDTTTTPEIAAQNRMVGKVFIKPMTTSEIIEVQFVLTSQSANFQELIS